MADPYAKRSVDPAGDGPVGDPSWLEAVDQSLPADSGYVVVRDAGPLAPIARAAPQLATAIATFERSRVVESLDPERPTLLIKHGWVAGPESEPGCMEVVAEMLAPVLDPEREVVWEVDPDFGYEVPVAVEGLNPASARILCPRFHYADHGRVYEYAELVVATKQRWFERLSEMEGVPEEVLAASGWPPVRTGSDWRAGDEASQAAKGRGTLTSWRNRRR